MEINRCAVMLLTLTCPWQMYAYFRMRAIAMPQTLLWFWLAAAFMMVLVIMWGATNLPMPVRDHIAYANDAPCSPAVDEGVPPIPGLPPPENSWTAFPRNLPG